MTYELYRHPDQINGRFGEVEDGFWIEKRLRNENLLGRALSIESDLVKGWQANPDTYPEELRGIHPVLWGSVRQAHNEPHGVREVAYLQAYVYPHSVRVEWKKTHHRFHGHEPALLAPSIEG